MHSRKDEEEGRGVGEVVEEEMSSDEMRNPIDWGMNRLRVSFFAEKSPDPPREI